MKTFLDKVTDEIKVVDRLILKLAKEGRQSLCMLIEQLPLHFRVTSIESSLTGNLWVNIAEIYHQSASLRVSWESLSKPTIQINQIASIRWKGHTISVKGAVLISRLVTIDAQPKGFNVFETVPTSWINQRQLLERTINITRSMPSQYLTLINSIFWDADRLNAFIKGPSSLRHHHAHLHGNLLHTIEMCELASKVVLNQTVKQPLLTLLCFLHDIGKAEEYIQQPRTGNYVMSTRGKLIGHKITSLEWVIEARARNQALFEPKEWLHILHALASVQGIADWTGIRNAQTKEALLLAQIDSLSTKQGY